jgi:hypothetical protein
MKRRSFVLASGTAVMSSSRLFIQKHPVVGLNFEISEPDKNPSSVNSILLEFRSLEITPRYIDDSEDMSITSRLELEDGSEKEKTRNISVENGETKKISSIFNPIYTAGIDIDGNYLSGSVTISVEHPDVSDQYNQGIVISDAEIPDSVLTQDMIAWYRFEDGDARDYASSSEFPSFNWGDSTSYNGTVNDQNYEPSKGIRDFGQGLDSGAFEFNGRSNSSGRAIILPDIISGNDNLSMTGWIKMSDFNNDNAYLVSLRESQYSEMGCLSGNWLFKFGDNNAKIESTKDLQNNTWIHIAQTANSSTGTAYVNGSDIGTVSIQSRVLSGTNTIGGRNGGDQYVDGFIDDVRIYNRELTPSEISDIYNATKP